MICLWSQLLWCNSHAAACVREDVFRRRSIKVTFSFSGWKKIQTGKRKRKEAEWFSFNLRSDNEVFWAYFLLWTFFSRPPGLPECRQTRCPAQTRPSMSSCADVLIYSSACVTQTVVFHVNIPFSHSSLLLLCHTAICKPQCHVVNFALALRNEAAYMNTPDVDTNIHRCYCPQLELF